MMLGGSLTRYTPHIPQKKGSGIGIRTSMSDLIKRGPPLQRVQMGAKTGARFLKRKGAKAGKTILKKRKKVIRDLFG